MGFSVERGLWLEELCRQKGWRSREVFAQQVGVERHSVTRWWRGGPIKEYRHQARVCELLGIRLGQLLDGPYSVDFARHDVTTQTFDRRSSGWKRETLWALVAALIPAYEEVLRRKGENEVTRLILLQIHEIAPSFDVQRRVLDLIRHALYQVAQEREGIEPLRLEDGSTIAPKPLPAAPADWNIGWESERQKRRRTGNGD